VHTEVVDCKILVVSVEINLGIRILAVSLQSITVPIQ